nr:ribonuclease P protein component [Sanguibacter hominis]
MPAAQRLRRSADFGRTVRKGARAGRSTMVVHLFSQESDESAMVGFVVSKAVGNAVVRNRVKRRLRHASSHLVESLPQGTTVVVRALPAAADCSYAQLTKDLAACVTRARTVRAPR